MPAGGASGPSSARRSRTSARAAASFGPYGVVTVNAVRSPRVVAEQGLGDEPIRRAVGDAVEQLVLLERQPRVDVDEAVDPLDPRVGREAARVVVERREFVGSVAGAGRADGERRSARTAPAELARVSRSNACRDGTRRGQDRARRAR